MWTNDTGMPIYGDKGLRRSPQWRLALLWQVLWRMGWGRGSGPDALSLSDHLRRDIGQESANAPTRARDDGYRRFL